MRIFQHIFRIWCVFLIFDFFWRIFYSYTINLRTHWKSILKAIYSFILMLTWRISSRKNTFKKSSLELDKHSMRVEPLCHFESGSESCSVMSDSLWPQGLYSPWNSPGQNTGVGSLSLLQGIFPTQRSNPGILHCRWILYQLNHKEPITPGDLATQQSNPHLLLFLHCRRIL